MSTALLHYINHSKQTFKKYPLHLTYIAYIAHNQSAAENIIKRRHKY